MRTFIAILLSSTLAAQQAPKTTVKFEATSQLVVLNVAARDKNGNNIEGLKASDFTVTEDGKNATDQSVRVSEIGGRNACRAGVESAAGRGRTGRASPNLP